VQIGFSGLPAANLVTEPGSWAVGPQSHPLVFPLGRAALQIYERVNQVAPITSRGRNRERLPISGPRPHGFTVDIMTLGGESGSPIFRADSPRTLSGFAFGRGVSTERTLHLLCFVLVAEAFANYRQSVPLISTA